jgi:excisionase family DNA binding protein
MVRAVEFTFDQAVATMGVTPERLEKLIAEGKVRTVEAGGRTLIPRESILEYFAQNSPLLTKDRKKLQA